ncbi:hypothetical protein [Staphylococcus shinii]
MEIVKDIVQQSLDFIIDKVSSPYIGGTLLFLVIFVTIVNSAFNK